MGRVQRGKQAKERPSSDTYADENRRATDLDAEMLRTAAMASKAWPYEEARKLLKRWPDGKPTASR